MLYFCLDSLECFSCTDAVNVHECKSVEKCDEGQVRYHHSIIPSQNLDRSYDLLMQCLYAVVFATM
jgi:hypothetical protein